MVRTSRQEPSQAATAAGSLLLPCLAATVAGLLLAELSLITTVRTDYSIEAQPAFDALRDGHIGQNAGGARPAPA